MAKKNKRPQQKKPQRGGGPSVRPTAGSSPLPPIEAADPGPTPIRRPSPTPAPAPAPRPLPVSRPAPRAARGRQQAGPLPPQDASIPLERVPYFRADLRRIAITAGLMFVLLIVGSIVLRNLLLA